jgi:LacI family transcriptional regulator, repressor for deo operon, udp, cdd, tsx, nupC, and nupG
VSVSMRDVARRAGVSVKTVSNVVNDYAHVSSDTRRRVMTAIEDLGYRPNLSARKLRGGRSGLIALAVPDVRMPYFAELTSAITAAAELVGQTVLVDQTNGARDRELLLLGGLRRHLIDGLIFSPLALGAAEIAAAGVQVPMVLLGERVGKAATVDHVAIDNVAAARHATEHLIKMGRRRIAALGYRDSPNGGTAQLRATGYEQALHAAGLSATSSLHGPAAGFYRRHGAESMRALLDLDPPPDAVFCFSDLLALGALRTLQECGVSVPADMDIIGVDDIEEGQYSFPSLTTVSPDKDELAQVAVDLLLARIAGYDGPPEDKTISHRLVFRESSPVRAVSRRAMPSTDDGTPGPAPRPVGR